MEVNSSIQPFSESEFQEIRDYIHQHFGINLTSTKKTMLAARLSKRLRQLRIKTYREYFQYATNPSHEEELVGMVNLLSTNKTDFFREDEHFNYLQQVVIPSLVKAIRSKRHKDIIQVWSAGCSSGEEPYTLAMVLNEALAAEPQIDFSILATDISTCRLQEARHAVYSKNKIAPIPSNLLKKYFMKGVGQQAGNYRVVPELRQKVSVQRLNFCDQRFNIIPTMDIIFCRNVTIYFDRETQIDLAEKFFNHLAPGGHYFIGHSETLNSISNAFEVLKPAIYRKPLK